MSLFRPNAGQDSDEKKNREPAADEESAGALTMDRRTFLKAVGGSVGMRALRPALTAIAAGLGGVASLAAPQAAKADVLDASWAKLFKAGSADIPGAALRCINYWGDDSVAGPTIISRNNVCTFLTNDGVESLLNETVSRRADQVFGEMGINTSFMTMDNGRPHNWFPAGDDGVIYQTAKVIRLDTYYNDVIVAKWPKVGTFYGFDVGCEVTIEAVENTRTYNNWGTSDGSYNFATGNWNDSSDKNQYGRAPNNEGYADKGWLDHGSPANSSDLTGWNSNFEPDTDRGAAGRFFAKSFGNDCKHFVVIPKRFCTNWWLVGVKAARFRFKFFYTDDGFNYTGNQDNYIKLDQAYIAAGGLMFDAGGTEWIGAGEGFNGFYLPASCSDRRAYLKRGVMWGSSLTVGGTSGLSSASNRHTIISGFSNTDEIVYYVGDTAGQVSYGLNISPYNASLKTKLHKMLWNGAGAGAPPVPNGVYKIFAVDASSGAKYSLDVPHGRAVNLSPLQVWSYTSGDHRPQTWVVTAASDGGVQISPVNNLLMSFMGAGSSSGDAVILAANGSSAATQKWYPTKKSRQGQVFAADGKTGLEGFTLSIGSVDSGVLLAASDTKNGSVLKLASPDSGYGGCIWYFEPVDSKGNSIAAEVEGWVNDGLPAPSADTGAGGKFRYSCTDKDSLKPETDVSLTFGELYKLKESASHSAYLVDGREYWACLGPFGTQEISFVDYPRKARFLLRKRAAVKPTNGAFLIPNGTYRIRNKAGGYLDLYGNASDARGNGCRIMSYSEATDDAWTVINSADGTRIMLQPVNAAGYKLDIDQAAAAVGQKIHLWTSHGKTSQQWVPVALADGSFNLLSALDDSYCLYTDGTAAMTGRDVTLASYAAAGGSLFSRWLLEPVSGKTFVEYANSLPAAGQGSLESMAAATYGIYSDASCTEEVARYTVASSTKNETQLLSGVDVGVFSKGWCGAHYFLKEIEPPYGYDIDSTVYHLYRPIDDDYAGSDSVVELVDVPNLCLVHFLLVDKNDKATEVSSYKVRYGSAVSTSDEGFAEADGKVKGFYGVATDEFVYRWFQGSKQDGTSSGFKDIDFMDAGKRFAGVDKATGDIWLYGKCDVGQVTFYCDGTDEAHVVRVDAMSMAWAASEVGADLVMASTGGGGYGVWGDSGVALARLTNVYLGTRIKIPAEVEAAAARANCTPGWDGWFADKSDKAFSADEPGQGGGSRLAETSLVLRQPVTDLYSVNRATLSFGYVDGSERPEDFADRCHKEPDASSAAADVSMPGACVKRVDVTRALPTRSLAYAEQDDGRWRTYTPKFWFAAQDGTGSTSRSIRMSSDATRYIEWEQLTRDGVVDVRG